MKQKHLKRGVHILKKFFLGIAAFILLYVAAVFVLSHITVNSKVRPGKDVTIYVRTNGVHTDIVVPVKNKVKDWSSEILFAHTASKDSLAEYIAFGWGDKGFYLNTPKWSDLKLSTAVKAALHLGTSAMHTHFYKDIQQDADCLKLTLSNADYKRLVQYISASFQLDASNKVQCIKNRGYGGYDAFYEAHYKYSLFYTCNTWANNALTAANQKAALWTVYDKGIFLHYR
ncbi:TIGR02117 family protein [Flavobacterium sp. MK4S-17]|uniref:TIGR02117 family protein n=1 Tax=Flavobacterium sp. MK4S-17 TaxID=2543737 RepID=UPI00135BA3ED|nr:TIGR02117 family protein [Flavobacterium sp. MK4S-17]